ncbi:hypothetical protein [Nonomuraea soli]|nr:hypothetical protein [Nonomuraea soli]
MVRLRTSQWDRIKRAHGYTTDEACAQKLQVARTTITRIKSGDVEPSQKFIAALLWHFQGARFEDLFEVVVSSNAAEPTR